MSASVLACLCCRSEVGRQVREALFAADFWQNAALVLLPFHVLAGAGLAFHAFSGIARRRRAGRGRPA